MAIIPYSSAASNDAELLARPAAYLRCTDGRGDVGVRQVDHVPGTRPPALAPRRAAALFYPSITLFKFAVADNRFDASRGSIARTRADQLHLGNAANCALLATQACLRRRARPIIVNSGERSLRTAVRGVELPR